MGLWQKLFGPPDKDGFAQKMIKLLRESGEDRPLEYDSEEFLLRLGESHQIFLGNVYDEYLAEPRAGRKELLARFVRVAHSADRDHEMSFAEAKGRLLPRVRERFYHESIRLNALKSSEKDGEFKPFPTRLLNDHLTVELVIDLPDKVGVMSAMQLDDWGVSFDDAIAIGRENFWKLSTKSFDQLGPGLYVSSVGDTHDASRMFLHDLVWQHEVRGQHVVIPANRNVLLLCGSEDVDGLLKMAELADEVMQQPRAQTAMAFVLHDATWKPFLPPVGSPAYHPLRNLAIQSMMRDYDEQKGLLEKIFEKKGRDIFVGSASGMKRNIDQSIFTFSTWAENVETLLPETEYVAFGRDVGEGEGALAGFGRWERVVKVAGELMQRTVDYPPRYFVKSFPTPQQLAAMDLSPDPP
jgi:hypothetical protein